MVLRVQMTANTRAKPKLAVGLARPNLAQGSRFSRCRTPHHTAPHHTAPQAPGLTFGPILNAVRALAGSRVLWLAGPLGYRAPLCAVGAPAGACGLLRSTVCFRQYLPSTISWLRTCFETPRPTCIKPACDVTHRPRFRQGASICGCTDPWRRPHGMNLD